jgi:hypothetical protein
MFALASRKERRNPAWSRKVSNRRWTTKHSTDPSLEDYPHGRGYGHDYMRGGEVLGGYGYADRLEYEKPRGEAAKETKAKEAKEERH